MTHQYATERQDRYMNTGVAQAFKAAARFPAGHPRPNLSR
jgi:hypothetical protein